jgi:hypothetical protein
MVNFAAVVEHALDLGLGFNPLVGCVELSPQSVRGSATCAFAIG